MSILKENGINHIPIIVGFKKEMLIEHIQDTHFVENPDYESTNAYKMYSYGPGKRQ
jgi:CTP:phosphocholine cytidylyltransferase-like protein